MEVLRETGESLLLRDFNLIRYETNMDLPALAGLPLPHVWARASDIVYRRFYYRRELGK